MRRDGYNAKGDRRSPKSQAAYRGQRDYSILPRSPSEALEPDRAPEPPRGNKQRPQHPVIAFLHRLMTFLVIMAICAAGAVYYVRHQFEQPGPLNYPTAFVVAREEGVKTIARHLEEEGIITDRWTFRIASYYFRYDDKIKAGEYSIKANATIRNVLDELVKGKSIGHRITIPEGLTSYQIVERMRANPDLVGDIDEIPAEGTMLPDTYAFDRATSRADLIRRMQGVQKKFLDELWPARAKGLPLATPEDALNLAAIVEKETSVADERRHVAAVYLNRLRKGMLLQADPTIVYGITNGQGALGRPIRRSELDNRENPYNTYRHKGLPPTPIANPGRDAIIAVLNPDQSSDLYFVANGTGGHEFSATLEEHNRNVAKWRRFLKEQHEDEEDEAAARTRATAPAPAPAGMASVGLDKLPVAEIPLPQRNPRR